MNPKTMKKWAKIVGRVDGYVLLATLIMFCKEEWLDRIINNPDQYIAPWLPKEGGFLPLTITTALQLLFQLGALRAEMAPDKAGLRQKLDEILQHERKGKGEGDRDILASGAAGQEMETRSQYAETVQHDGERVRLSQADTKRLVAELMQAAGTPLEPSIAKWMIDASLRLGGSAAALIAMVGSMYQQQLMPANGVLFTIALTGVTYGRAKTAWMAEDQNAVEILFNWLGVLIQGVTTGTLGAVLIPAAKNPAWEKTTMFDDIRWVTALFGIGMALGPERDAIVKAPGRIYRAGQAIGGFFGSCRERMSGGYKPVDARREGLPDDAFVRTGAETAAAAAVGERRSFISGNPSSVHGAFSLIIQRGGGVDGEDQPTTSDRVAKVRAAYSSDGSGAGV